MDRTQQLAVDEWLNPGDTLTSTSKNFQLVMQDDGNLVLYQLDPSGVRQGSSWASNTSGKVGAKAVMQSDGNFVVYGSDGKAPLWSSNSTGHSGAHVEIGDDGTVVIYDAAHTRIWAAASHPVKAIADAAESALASLKDSVSKLTNKPQ